MIKVVYVGQDTTYFEDLKARFLKESEEEMSFEVLWHDDPNTFQMLSKEIVESLPNICLLDYSSHPEKMMTVARTLPRLLDRGPSLIGLWDYHATKAQILESKTLGIPFTHFKSPEIGDLVSQALFLFKDTPFPEGEFAKAETMKKPVFVEATSLFRIGYLTTEYAHVEHDFLPPENVDLLMHHAFDEEFPIDRFRLVRRLDFNYYYETAYTSDLSYVFLDPNENGAKEGTKKDKKARAFWQKLDDENVIEAKKRKVQEYINEKGEGPGGAKRTRIMVVDSDMRIVEQADKPLDNYPYSIRFFRSIHNKPNLVKRIKPGILCYQCPEGEGDEGELKIIMQQVINLENYNPFVVVFRSDRTSEYLQKHYSYSRVISWDQAFDFKQLLSFCETYESKAGREKSHDMTSSFHSKEKRHYISKSDTSSYMEYPFSIELRSICETWVKIQTEQDLAKWSIVSIKEPVIFDITIIEKLDEREWLRAGCFQYRAVVHGLGERERANMRKAINQIIYEEENHEKFLEEKRLIEEAEKKEAEKKEGEEN